MTKSRAAENGTVTKKTNGVTGETKVEHGSKRTEGAKMVPPDGGWGWMVVFSSFIIHIIADGIVYSFGIFFVEFIDYFGAGRGETSWIASILVGVTLGSGPIASVVTNRFGCRPCTMAGGVLAGLGLILGMMSPSLIYLYFTFGLMAGFGFGLIYLPAIVSVGFYFEKRRAIATGLAVCGSGIGTFIFAPLVSFLVQEYTWKGATLILAGLTFNGIVCGALFRPLPGEVKVKAGGKKASGPEEGPEAERLLDKPQSENLAPPQSVHPLSFTSSAPVIQEEGEDGEVDSKYQITSVVTLGKAKPPPKLSTRLASADHVPIHKSSEPTVMYYELNASAKPSVTSRRSERSDTLRVPDDKPHRPLHRKDIFYSGSLYNIPMYRSDPDFYRKSVTSIDKLGTKASASKISSPASDKVELPGERSNCSPCCSKENRDMCSEMMDFSLLKDTIFLLFAISNFLTSVGFNGPFIYIPDRAEAELNLTKHQAALLLSVVGISNTIGRVLFGFTSDHPFVRRHRLFVYSGALTVCGAATMLSVYATTYATMIIYSAVFGATIGAYVTLTSVLLVDLLGLDKLTNSFGLLLLFQGVATLGGPPLAGSLYDATQSYTIPFLVIGACLGLSGLMLFPVPILQRFLARRKGISQRDVQLGKVIDEKDASLVVADAETVL